MFVQTFSASSLALGGVFPLECPQSPARRSLASQHLSYLGLPSSSPPSTLRSCEFPHFRLDSVSSSSRTLWLPPCRLACLSFSAFSPDCTDCLSPFTRVLWPRVRPLFTIGCHFCCVESKRSVPAVPAPPSRGPSPSKSLLFP